MVFNTDEIRSFIYILTPKDPKYKINKFQTEILGQLEIKWFNYLGDPGNLKVGPFRHSGDTMTKFEIEITQLRNQKMELALEVPQLMSFKIYNLSSNQMKLELGVQESEQNDIFIQGFEDGTENIGTLLPMEYREFTLKLFALKCGILPLCGLIIKDAISGKEIFIKKSFCAISVLEN